MTQDSPETPGTRGADGADPQAPSGERTVLVLTHTGRATAVAAARELVDLLRERGLRPVMLAEEVGDIPGVGDVPVLDPDELEDSVVSGAEMVVVLGGDGTILRAAELVRHRPVPLLGVNLGHVGFLAESERDDLARTVDRIAARDYVVEERLTLDVRVLRDGEVVTTSWAVNEASVEKAERERMLEVVTEVDGRPVSVIGCDGVVMATPTGSTAYAFSAGGPVVWPEVQALLMVPISAHALFAKPLVASPGSVLAVEVLSRTAGGGVLWCDGRRTAQLPPGSRIEVTRGVHPLLLARISDGPFTDRLVAKFRLPVEGWRGPVDPLDEAADEGADGAADDRGGPSGGR
ncbi:NAD kinase [uncultured Pseudokineococcus sp.]|uniref:NAD kinase n=1 Tax=uncultured Pseudokineococcus sp. TaxID=1642928 RepID=UPI002627731F|nr:NAD kinase [uncultured Pseudokineococcus sp.]